MKASEAATIKALIAAGFEPDVVVDAVFADDLTKLIPKLGEDSDGEEDG